MRHFWKVFAVLVTLATGFYFIQPKFEVVEVTVANGKVAMISVKRDGVNGKVLEINALLKKIEPDEIIDF